MTFAAIDETHDPALVSWVASAEGHVDFPVQNLPYGVFSNAGRGRRIGVAIGDLILDLAAISDLLPVNHEAVRSTTLNALLAGSPAESVLLRRAVSALLCDRGRQVAIEPHLHSAQGCEMHLPAQIGDYTDFYVGIHHATNIGKLFRPDNPLLPNYKYVPIGYHGRASSVRASGVAVRRPSGQRKAPDGDFPLFGPSMRLDYELELGIWIGGGNELGEPVPIGDAASRIAGFCLLNDWSARDFQAWEYVPLGPFLSKSFHSTISPWVITAEAMAPFRLAQPPRPEGDPQPLPHLWDEADQSHGALGLDLEVFLSSAVMRAAGMAAQRLSVGPATSMYWTAQQIVAHHASNGCNLSAGDLLGTGTLSSSGSDGYGSLMEMTEGGRTKISLPTGEERTFLEDGDEVVLKATARAEGYVPIGFGQCRAIIEPAR
ncbi:fumarylacetoacetase [Novosphingobium resinovorum]|uniref:fumarylacetoacetase n=1 Tax=Novosphingobium resinovorum TaxID=158500 RepID=UPI002ED2E0D7|nr:fumarylacetoacetase [Novosphingobium resinovorum]